MRTEEIDVFLDQKYLDWVLAIKDAGPLLTKGTCVPTDIKAKLIIEMPEKKAEITESEFDEFAADLIKTTNPIGSEFNIGGVIAKWKQNLFGD